MNVVIYGVPGSGKTTLARLLSPSLNLPFFEADEVRAIAQKGKTPENNPYYFLPTTEAYKAIGSRTKKNVINGMLNVRSALSKFIEQKISSYRNGVVVEAAFLDPKSLSSSGVVLLLVTPSESLHRSHFLVHRTSESFENGQFENARLIQDFLISEAKVLNVPILENVGDANDLMTQAKKHVV